jgi:ABC-type sugar transport system substrate-binding protein
VSPTNLLQPLSSVSKRQPIIKIYLPIDLNAAAKANVTITSYMGSDSVATGAVAGKYMLAILPNGSTVALIGGLPADPCYQGVEACIAALAGKSVPKNVPTPVLVVTKEKDYFASGRIGRNPA